MKIDIKKRREKGALKKIQKINKNTYYLYSGCLICAFVVINHKNNKKISSKI